MVTQMRVEDNLVHLLSSMEVVDKNDKTKTVFKSETQEVVILFAQTHIYVRRVDINEFTKERRGYQVQKLFISDMEGVRAYVNLRRLDN